MQAGKGGKRVGAGRKPNVIKQLGNDIFGECFSPEKQKRLWESMLRSEDERIRLDAGKYLTDRLYGKAHQAVDLNHSGEMGLVLKNSIPRPAREK